MIDVNFIVTCYNREAYWPHLKSIIQSYKNINAHIALCYNGHDDNFACDFRCTNHPNGGRGSPGHTSGCKYAESDCELVVGGYNHLKSNGVDLWVKLSIDSWIIDEVKLIQILNKLESSNCAYAGNFWWIHNQMSTDIFFLNTKHNNILQDLSDHYIEFFDFLYSVPNPGGLEFFMFWISRQYDRLIIQDREPMSQDPPNNTRWVCNKLGWCMFHDLNSNINFQANYLTDNESVNFSIIEGSKVKYNLEASKPHI